VAPIAVPERRHGERMYGGKLTGVPKGNNNAYVHGGYTAEAVPLLRRRRCRTQ
jgi:hypothetical protein